MLAEFKALIVSIFMAVNVESAPQPAINIDNIKEMACMSQAVHGEAGNQSMKGKIAVAFVIKHRAESGSFPDGICQVIHQKGQFKFFKNLRWHKRTPAEEQQMEDSVKAAYLVMNEEVNDPTRGALYYVNPKMARDTGWLKHMKRLVRIEDHVFYIDKA